MLLVSSRTSEHQPDATSLRRFCFPCIVRWAEIENRCPFCKARFRSVRRKLLEPASPAAAGSSPRWSAVHELPGTVVEVFVSLPTGLRHNPQASSKHEHVLMTRRAWWLCRKVRSFDPRQPPPSRGLSCGSMRLNVGTISAVDHHSACISNVQPLPQSGLYTCVGTAGCAGCAGVATAGKRPPTLGQHAMLRRTAAFSQSGHACPPQTVEVSDRDQRPEGGGGDEGEPEDPMADVACLECGRGDDDEHLLLCDGVAAEKDTGASSRLCGEPDEHHGLIARTYNWGVCARGEGP